MLDISLDVRIFGDFGTHEKLIFGVHITYTNCISLLQIRISALYNIIFLMACQEFQNDFSKKSLKKSKKLLTILH